MFSRYQTTDKPYTHTNLKHVENKTLVMDLSHLTKINYFCRTFLTSARLLTSSSFMHVNKTFLSGVVLARDDY